MNRLWPLLDREDSIWRPWSVWSVFTMYISARHTLMGWYYNLSPLDSCTWQVKPSNDNRTWLIFMTGIWENLRISTPQFNKVERKEFRDHCCKHICWRGCKFTEESNRHRLCRSTSPTDRRFGVESTFINISIPAFCWSQSPLSSFRSSLPGEEESPSAGQCSSWDRGPSSWALNSSRACRFDSISSCSLPLSESFRSSRSSR